MKSKEIGIRMSTKVYKICNGRLLPPFNYYRTSNAKNKKGSNNKMALICVGEVTSRVKKHHVYNYKVGETSVSAVP